ncbi:uncharacterized protein LOC122621845 [Drosophila teissieri]|uniref:uncharacterized protein LOC122621845 n=1 Tax=Drosophila teissieri TaxID=7243 RepID=UPI001CB9E442|nr:uncharacterized protein LOC122621845 [Drosophila teissieri]
MELLFLISVLLATQWTTAQPTVSNAPEINIDKLLGLIGGVVNEGIKLHFPQQKTEGGNNGDTGGGPYSKGQSGGPPIVGVSKYDIIDLKFQKPN